MLRHPDWIAAVERGGRQLAQDRARRRDESIGVDVMTVERRARLAARQESCPWCGAPAAVRPVG